MENEIVAKLQEQLISNKATKHFSQLVAQLQRRKTDLVCYLSHLGGQGEETAQISVSQACFVSVFILVFRSAIESLLSL